MPRPTARLLQRPGGRARQGGGHRHDDVCLRDRSREFRGPEVSSEQETSGVAGRPAWVDLHLANRLKIPHTFVVHTYTKPTKCHLCNKMLVGVFKQGLQCKDCRYNVHKKCCDFTPRDCTGDVRLELEVKSV